MPASRFHDGHHGATHIVTLTIDEQMLRIVDASGTVLAVWPRSLLAPAPDVDPDGVVALTARDRPGVLLVDDATVLASLRAAGVRLPRRRAWASGHWLGLLAATIAVFGMFAVAITALPGWVAAMIPPSWERKLGIPAEILVAGATPPCTGAAGQAALERLVERLRVTGGIETPVDIIVLNDELVNAFTLPGGRVLLMRGLIAAADGPELAGVIAHELGHVAHRDSTALLIRGLGLSIVLYTIGLGDSAGPIAQGAGSLLTLAYGRAAETRADATAITLLTSTGLRADGLSRFFAHMERRAAESGKADTGNEKTAREPSSRGKPALNWLSTHPPSETRRERTARAASGEMPFSEGEMRAIRSMCERK